MSALSWEDLPYRFLKMSYKGWKRLDRDVRRLILDLAQKQHFKCALCTNTRDLVVDHDHDPEEGPGFPFTVFNVRGLVCSSCNWHITLYETQCSGDYYSGWENATCRILDREYDRYDYAYRCRVRPLIETMKEQRMGSLNYWRRELYITKFDDWFYDRGFSPWRDRWMEERRFEIRTPKRFLRSFSALVDFAIKKSERDPSWRPPDQFFEIVLKVRKMIAEVRPELLQQPVEQAAITA